MRLKQSLFALIVPLAGWAPLAGAQAEKPGQNPPPPPAPDRVKAQEARDAKVEMPFCHKASEVIGAKVKNPQGEDLGEIEELVIEPSTGRIEYAVLSFGGFLGLGDKLFALPFRMLKAPEVPEDSRLAHYTLNVDKERLKKAPGFPKDNWPDIHSPSWSSEIDEYFEVQRETDPSPPKDDPARAIEKNKQFRLCKASNLMGKDVHNPSDDELGEIKEIVLDPRSARVTYIALSTGDFLGLDRRVVAVPWEALSFDIEDEKQKCVLSVSKERIEKAPEFDEDNWKRMSDPVWVNEMYDYYGARPYWRGEATEAGYPKGGKDDQDKSDDK